MVGWREVASSEAKDIRTVGVAAEGIKGSAG
jgi:hypothetical protein